MPYTPKQVRFLESSGTPLTAVQKAKMNRELHENPSLGHYKKGHMSKVDAYKKSKRKAERVDVEKADDGSGFITRTHYPGPIDGSKNGTLIRDNGPEIGVHKNLSSVHRHMNDCMCSAAGSMERE